MVLSALQQPKIQYLRTQSKNMEELRQRNRKGEKLIQKETKKSFGKNNYLYSIQVS